MSEQKISIGIHNGSFLSNLRTKICQKNANFYQKLVLILVKDLFKICLSDLSLVDTVSYHISHVKK